MKYSFETNLSVKGLTQLARELDIYANRILPSKVDVFIERLAEKGITVAKGNLNNTFSPCVDFIYKPTGSGKGEIESQTQLIHRVWYKHEGKGKNKTLVVSGEYDISPILMAEFGAGPYAQEGWRGTLGKNGLRDVWYWFDENGTKHSSTYDDTIIPTHPMHSAVLEMEKVYRQVADEVFGNE